jgi:hypothetical protein
MRNLILSKEQWFKFSRTIDTNKHQIYGLVYSMGYYYCRVMFVG